LLVVFFELAHEISKMTLYNRVFQKKITFTSEKIDDML